MRILLDESAPRGLKELLPGHEVKTVPEQGWASKLNGELLGLAVADRFDVFVTPDLPTEPFELRHRRRGPRRRTECSRHLQAHSRLSARVRAKREARRGSVVHGITTVVLPAASDRRLLGRRSVAVQKELIQ